MTRMPALLVVLALGGCAIMRPTDPYPLPAPAPVTGPASPAPQRHAMAPAELDEPLDLPAAIAIALARNPDLAAAGWDAVAAEARHDQVSAERWPRWGLVGGYTHHLDEQRLLPVRQPGDPAVLSRDIVTGDLVLSMPLFTGGRLAHRVKAAELLGQAAAQRLARTREELVFNVSSLFFTILAQERAVQSLEFSRGALSEHLARVEQMVAAQKVARVDRMRTEVRLADLDQRLAWEKSLLAIQRRGLANLLGLEGAQSDALALRGELIAEPGGPEPDLESLLASAMQRRGDYLAARAALEAQARGVDAARAARWPAVFLQGSYGGRWAVGPWTGEGDELDDTGRVGLTMELPLFDGGGIAARVREERADLAAARERLRRTELQMRLELETAQLGVSAARERAAAIGKAIELARESLRIEQQKYELGKGAIVDVLDAQAALLEAETNYFRVLADLHTARAQLRLAAGEQE